MPTPATCAGSPSLACLHAGYLALLPRLIEHGQISFRLVKCPQRKEEYLAEIQALGWKWYVRLIEQGKDPASFPSALATFLARAVSSGRRLCGQDRAKDVLSPRAQGLQGFTVATLPTYSTLDSNPLEEALQDNTRSEVPEAVAFKLDFPCWRATRCRRDRRLMDRLMVGERTLDVARRFGPGSKAGNGPGRPRLPSGAKDSDPACRAGPKI
ncbi:MAG: hypothetical protein L0Z62_16120, partial [Gemmataceae bacterium]|nr:hypothetical protein [Gemmataceae bacterium]